jgi:predicted RNase H-like HicB family nuclease
MLSEYLDAALQTARYEVMEDGRYWAEVTAMPGVWATAATQEDCGRELREVAEEWTLMAYWFHTPLPVIGGIDPNLKMEIEPDSDETTGADPEAAQPGLSGTVPGRQKSLHGPG